MPHTDTRATSATSDTHKSTVPPVAINTSNWTEHTSPDGYKYYYNSVTGESKVRVSLKLLLLFVWLEFSCV